jgi:hypothetical protein
MSSQDQKTELTDLLSLVTDASGSVVPHEHSALPGGSRSISTVAPSPAVAIEPVGELEADTDAAATSQVAQRQRNRRTMRRKARVAAAELDGLALGGSTAFSPNPALTHSRTQCTTSPSSK